jgi:hypothetical protein
MEGLAAAHAWTHRNVQDTGTCSSKTFHETPPYVGPLESKIHYGETKMVVKDTDRSITADHRGAYQTLMVETLIDVSGILPFPREVLGNKMSRGAQSSKPNQLYSSTVPTSEHLFNIY